ncbi:aminopeptidase N [Nocardioides guangzhouensis]|uniref:Aminopeptidase N n=1 Tax=Nocardioides guangzhouensis TaxID=2497878 RepID=A0A4Q4ZFZ4_9ACTN|nr:aminopeptidase N [Nocardioides guangzhouensis]RYP87072.1 aminopeptidase N [Nocardioides guangzhouensis]
MPLTDSPFRSLQQTEAEARFALLDVTSYDVRLDLDRGEETFDSVTTIRFDSRGGDTFLDLKPVSVRSIHLNGAPLSTDLLTGGRVPLTTQAGANEVVVDAVMRYRTDGEGLHRSVDPADGRHYVYGMSFMDAAPSIFACFDQPDLKAPYALHVRAPREWTVIGNAPGEQVEPGVWELPETRPLSTYFVTLVAGPYHVIRDEHDGIPLGLSSRVSIAKDLDADADELLTMTRQCFDEFHRLFDIRYPFGSYHQAFVPEFNAGAMENPGCVTFRDPLVFSSRVTRGQRIQRATTVAHEMAHQWFGNITTPRWWDDLWLNESFAEYMGNRVTADVTEFHDAWTHDSYARRQWGLIADQGPSTHPVAGNGAVDATAALQDFDGISYAKGSSVLKQVNATLGDEAFFAGVRDHFERAFYGNATMHDLFGCWERASGVDLSSFTRDWLRTAGPDTLTVDRAAGVLRRTPPLGRPAERTHTLHVATGRDGGWSTTPLTVDASEVPFDAGDAAVVVDPGLDTWALVLPDEVSVDGYVDLFPATTDEMLRSSMWSAVRSAFHNAAIAPARVLAVAEAALPSETNDDAVGYTLPWLIKKVAPLSDDPVAALGRIHAACRALLAASPAGSTVQLAGFQAAIGSATDGDLLEGWLAGRDLPPGIEPDLDLRWRVLVQLAAMGRQDPTSLQEHLDAEPTARSRVEHTRAMASLPTADAKAWAWQRFTGEVAVPNYELEAAGLGMWRPGQESLTAPYVERYFAELPGAPSVHSGWMLGDVTEAFFPITALDPSTVVRANEVIEADGLDLTIRRNLVDATDELRRRIAVRATYGA